MLLTLTQPPLQLSREEAERRLRGVMLGTDGTAAIIANVSSHGVANQAQTVNALLAAAEQTSNLGAQNLRLAGSVLEAHAVDRAAEDSFTQLVLPSSFLGLTVSWLAMRGLRRAIVVLVLAGFGQLMAVALVYYTGQQFSAVLIVLPTLVFMLTLSGAVHLVNYYTECARTKIEGAGVRALSLGWKPCLLSSLTTMMGMGSLLTSQLAPVRQFGVYSAVGLGLATAALLLAFPAIVQWFGTSSASSGCSQPISPESSTKHGRFSIQAYVHMLGRNANLISAIGFVALVASLGGVLALRTSTKFRDMFPGTSKVNVDMAWIEQHLGPIATVEVLLRFGSIDSSKTFDRVRWVARVEQRLSQLPTVGGVASAATFLPSWSESSAISAVVKRAALRRSLENGYPLLASNRMVVEKNGQQIWRVLAKVSATSKQDYGTLTQLIAAATGEVLQTGSDTDAPTAEFTGLFPLVHATQITLLSDLAASFLSAFLLITPIMMLVTRSIWGGLLIMVPNVLPVTLAFGYMGWMGQDLDIAGILTASLALGIAVDDTLHFVCWYMQALPRCRSRLDAVLETFQACSAAMIHTTLIACLSMAPFLFAEFLPTQQFAKLMITILIGAIVGDLLLLPALLLSPLGSVVGRLSRVP